VFATESEALSPGDTSQVTARSKGNRHCAHSREVGDNVRQQQRASAHAPAERSQLHEEPADPDLRRGGLGERVLVERLERKAPRDDVRRMLQRRVADPAPDLSLVHSAYDEARKVFPQFDPSKVDIEWGGAIDNTPDGIPVVSECSQHPGVYLCTGFSGHGFSSSLGAARMLAEAIATGQASDDLKHMSHRRFMTGETLAPNIIY